MLKIAISPIGVVCGYLSQITDFLILVLAASFITQASFILTVVFYICYFKLFGSSYMKIITTGTFLF
jgi:hypothetical protein